MPAPSPSAYEVAARDAVSTLAKEVEPLARDAHDLDGLERVREVIIRVLPRAILGRTDPEASSDLVCWNECHGLLEGVALPYRTASRISALAYLSAPDRYHVIDTMVAMRERYESHPDERAALDVSIRDAAREFVDWYSTATRFRDGSACHVRTSALSRQRAGAGRPLVMQRALDKVGSIGGRPVIIELH